MARPKGTHSQISGAGYSAEHSVRITLSAISQPVVNSHPPQIQTTNPSLVISEVPRDRRNDGKKPRDPDCGKEDEAVIDIYAVSKTVR